MKEGTGKKSQPTGRGWDDVDNRKVPESQDAIGAGTQQYGLFGVPSSKKHEDRRPFSWGRTVDRGFRGQVAAAMVRRADEIRRADPLGGLKASEKLIAEAERYNYCGVGIRRYGCQYDDLEFEVYLSCKSRICEPCGRAYYRLIRDSVLDVLQPVFAEKRRSWGLFLLTLTSQKDRYGGKLPTRFDINQFYSETGELLHYFYGKYLAYRTPSGKVADDQRRTYKERQADGTYKTIKRDPVVWRDADGDEHEDWRQWKGAGAITVMELGRDNNNLHSHSVVYGPYIPKRSLVNAWLDITGDSFIVDIRPIHSPKKGAAYVAKYIAKPPTRRDPAAYADYCAMLKGSRRLRVSGIFYGKIVKDSDGRLNFVCPYCGRRLSLLGEYLTGAPEAEHVEPLYPLLREVRNRGSPLPLPPWADGLTPMQRATS